MNFSLVSQVNPILEGVYNFFNADKIKRINERIEKVETSGAFYNGQVVHVLYATNEHAMELERYEYGMGAMIGVYNRNHFRKALKEKLIRDVIGFRASIKSVDKMDLLESFLLMDEGFTMTAMVEVTDGDGFVMYNFNHDYDRTDFLNEYKKGKVE